MCDGVIAEDFLFMIMKLDKSYCIHVTLHKIRLTFRYRHGHEIIAMGSSRDKECQ